MLFNYLNDIFFPLFHQYLSIHGKRFLSRNNVSVPRDAGSDIYLTDKVFYVWLAGGSR